jgi:hypothetical protein
MFTALVNYSRPNHIPETSFFASSTVFRNVSGTICPKGTESLITFVFVRELFDLHVLFARFMFPVRGKWNARVTHLSTPASPSRSLGCFLPILIKEDSLNCVQ